MKGKLLILIILLTSTSTLYAKDDEKSPGPEENEFIQFMAPQGLELELGKENSDGTLSVGYLTNANLYSLSLAGKLKDNTAEFVDVDGLHSDTKLSLGWSRLFVKHVAINPPEFVEYDDDVVDYARFQLRSCQRLNQLIVKEREEPIDQCENENLLVGKLATNIISAADALKIAKLVNGVTDKCEEYLKKPYANRLEILGDCENAEKLKQKLRNIKNKIEKPPLQTFDFMNFSLGYLKSDFAWFDIPQTLNKPQKHEMTKEGYELSGSYGRVFSETLVRWEVGAKLQKGFSNAKANEQRKLCFPYEENDVFTECMEGLLLPPVEKKIISPFVRFSKQFSEKSLVRAVSLGVKYTFEDAEQQDGKVSELDRWVVEVPVYFITSAKDKISAGVKFSWVSEVRKNEDPLKFSIFISAPMSIF